jgi:hypothetical protein
MRDGEGTRDSSHLKHMRFNTRGLMALVLVAACAAAWFVGRAHEQRDAVNAARRAGAAGPGVLDVTVWRQATSIPVHLVK